MELFVKVHRSHKVKSKIPGEIEVSTISKY